MRINLEKLYYRRIKNVSKMLTNLNTYVLCSTDTKEAKNSGSGIYTFKQLHSECSRIRNILA